MKSNLQNIKKFTNFNLRSLKSDLKWMPENCLVSKKKKKYLLQFSEFMSRYLNMNFRMIWMEIHDRTFDDNFQFCQMCANLFLA